MSTRINDELAQVLEDTGRELAEHPDVQAWHQASAVAEASKEAQEIEDQLMQMTRTLQHKQQNGDISQEEIAEYRQLQSQYRSQPEIATKLDTEVRLKEISQEACDAISEQLGIDFANTAAPPSC